MFILTLDRLLEYENERSFSGALRLVSIASIPEASGKASQRRETILEAAEDVFLRKGFEGATMQDIAAAAGMSPGNIYRYFPGKASVIAGLVERDRADMNEKFALVHAMPCKLEAFEQLGKMYFQQEACLKSPLTLEIWASATRDPEIRAICDTIEKSVIQNIMSLLTAARDNGEIAPDIDLSMICDLVMLLADGVLRCSTTADSTHFNRQLDVMFAAVKAATLGHLTLKPTEPGDAA
jgi:TetR/AcrR family transcriptional regulator, repressor for uid operon